jgi:phosphoglycerol transferase MdoB-like AlkP superfamily enzyme
LPAAARLVLRILLFAGLFSAGTKVLGKLSGIGTTAAFFRTELPLLVFAYLGFYVLLRRSRYRSWMAALPLAVIYVAHDLHYVWYGNVFRLADVSELPELVEVLTLQELVTYSLLLLAPLLAYLLSIEWRKGLTAVVLLFLVSAVPIAHGTLAALMVDRVEHSGSVTEWSDQYSARDAGRLTMLLYHEARRRRVTSELSLFRGNDSYRALIDARSASLRRAGTPRNVHFIVLESFLDPTLFRNISYSTPPVHPDFVALFGGKEGLARSPVFGGRTCQAEFEALCGVPAFGRVGSVEFNVLAGRGISCLPALLRNNGYQTIASNAYKPDFFNTLAAYRSLGFGEIYFPLEYAPRRATYLSTGDVGAEMFLFDGDLLRQNLEHVRGLMPKRGPVFNYVLGIYGHSPHRINEAVRPHLIDVYGGAIATERLINYANQYYYRSGAVAEYVASLIKIDPNALIIVMSDHLPPLSGGPKHYQQLGYMDGGDDSVYYNRIYVIDKAVPVRYTAISHYDLPDLVVNILTDGDYCRSNSCNFIDQQRSRDSYFEAYMGLLAEELR